MSDTAPDTQPAPPPRSDLSLGDRCVEWCFRQMESNLRPPTALLAAWFTIAERNGRPLGLKVSEQNRPNHCAMAQCNAAYECKLPGELIPHRMRAGAKELMADAMGAKAWHSMAEVEQGWRPRTGDLAIYDRSTPSKPETHWWGHVDRVVETQGPDTYKNIGANEAAGGAWDVDVLVNYFDPKVRLLGFISYPTLEPVQRESVLAISDEDIAHVKSLNAMGLFEAEKILWDQYARRPG